MTQKEAGKYASMCAKAKREAKKTNTEYVRPMRPDHNQIEHMETITRNSKRNLRTLNYRMNVITQQMDMLVDFITELANENPQYREYFKMVDYVACSLYEIEETLKTI